jgi:hypothetical protein
VILATSEIGAKTAQDMINLLLAAEPGRAHMAVRSGDSFSVLRER